MSFKKDKLINMDRKEVLLVNKLVFKFILKLKKEESKALIYTIQELDEKSHISVAFYFL
ncbi:MAG: hypothetical protein KIC62_16825 [Clostridium sp.]|nr:hypothetical protein [Clostridium sp.]